MEGNGILHTIYVCLLYFVFGCEFGLFFCLFFLAPSIDIYKHNMGIMVLQTRLPLTGIFKQTDMTLFIQVLCVGFGDESVCSTTPV